MRALRTAAALLCGLIAGTAVAQEAPVRGGRLVVRLNSDVRSLEPGVNRDSQTDTVIHQLFEGLVAFRADLQVGPQLAESWTVSEDGRAYRFAIRPGATFHNGSPVTSAEVKWSWDRLAGAAGWACRRQFDGSQGLKVEAVEAPSRTEIVFRLAEPSALFLKQLAAIQCHVLVSHPASAEASGGWHPIGSGPLKLKAWKRGDTVTLERAAAYAPSKAEPSGLAGMRDMLLDDVVFRVIPDQSAAEAALQTGAIDILPDIDAERAAILKSRGSPIESLPGLTWVTLLLQTKDPYLADPRMRRAIAHAVDRTQLADIRTGGLGVPNSSGVSAATSYYDDGFASWPAYDPKRAQALAKEAGYSGQVLKIQTNKRYAYMYDNAVLVQAMLVQAGFKADLEVLDWATQLDNYLKGNFQLQTFGFSPRFDPSQMYAAVIGDKATSAWAQWDDPEAIRLLADSTHIADEAKRKDLFRRIHARMQTEVPIVGLYYDPLIVALHPSVRGHRNWPGGKVLTWGVWKRR